MATSRKTVTAQATESVFGAESIESQLAALPSWQRYAIGIVGGIESVVFAVAFYDKTIGHIAKFYSHCRERRVDLLDAVRIANA